MTYIDLEFVDLNIFHKSGKKITNIFKNDAHYKLGSFQKYDFFGGGANKNSGQEFQTFPCDTMNRIHYFSKM